MPLQGMLENQKIISAKLALTAAIPWHSICIYPMTMPKPVLQSPCRALVSLQRIFFVYGFQITAIYIRVANPQNFDYSKHILKEEGGSISDFTLQVF
jgi:hypothetical protein